MTGTGMNASPHRIDFALRLFAVAGAICALGGCATYDPFNPATDPSSPAASRVETLARADQTYPRWEDFPAAPQNVPSAGDIRTQVVNLEASELRLNREISAIQWTLTQDDLEPWAGRTRNRVDPRLSRPVDPNELADALAWAERIRARATPPPPIVH